MKNHTKKAIKASNGITLIALVITIIVLLILAGISISMLTGDNSILQKTTEAKTNTERKSVIELAQTDILGQIAENKGENISKDQLKDILDKYFVDIATLELPDDLSNSDLKLNAKQIYGGHQNIALTDIYNGKFKSIPVETNTFSVSNCGEYQFVEGTTWADWMRSTYNVDNFSTAVWYFPNGRRVDGIISGEGFGITEEDNTPVLPSDLIDSEKVYKGLCF